jgi:hypothetical protein
MALNDNDHALEVLMRGLTMDETAEKVKYDIVHKIMTLAYNYKGTIWHIRILGISVDRTN